jgi:magnesium-transporting ATPase (P-type)
MEARMNRLIIYIVIAQLILCAIIAIIGSFWYKENDDDADVYLPFDFLVGVNGIITYFSYFLLLNTMLPISLIVTLEIVKVA